MRNVRIPLLASFLLPTPIGELMSELCFFIVRHEDVTSTFRSVAVTVNPRCCKICMRAGKS